MSSWQPENGASIVEFDFSFEVKTSENVLEEKEGSGEVQVVNTGIGLLPDAVYDKQLPPLVAAFRRRVLSNLAWESDVLSRMQWRVRTPFLDAYFVNTSTLGTHTFFMTLLPAFCFFGHHDIGQGLLFVLALGVYASSFIKDLVCSPRPYAPPVTRLTIGSHHLEYGFPSTHSTNSVSIALFFFGIIHRLASTPVGTAGTSLPLINSTFSPPQWQYNGTFTWPQDLPDFAQNATISSFSVPAPQMVVSETVYWTSAAVLSFYVFSIVYGRLYTAMHSFTDCTVGVLLGAAIWVLFIYVGDPLDYWLKHSGWIVPAVVIPSCLLCVHRHPEPVDDCPCFEDAIAFMSVVMGEFITRWYMHQHGFDDSFFAKRMPGAPSGTLSEMWAWWSIALAKLVVGVTTIFTWRILAKSLLHRILPPTYRFLSSLMTLPHRRFYTPATDYTDVPFSPDTNGGLRAIPSVLDLPGMVEMEVDEGSVSASSARRVWSTVGDVKYRAETVSGSEGTEKAAGLEEENMTDSDKRFAEEEMGGKGDVVKHYDADVATKILVYAGIGILASGGMPIIFELIGWGIRM